MRTEFFIQQIDSCTALLKSRQSLYAWVLNNTEYISILFDIGLNNEHPNQHKAAWILEFLLVDNLSIIKPQLSRFCTQFQEIKNESSKRSLGKIASLITQSKIIVLNYKQKEILIETALDWLINTTKVASKCHAIDIILNLSPVFPEHTKLAKEIIEQQYASSSPAFQNRAKKFKQTLRYITPNEHNP